MPRGKDFKISAFQKGGTVQAAGKKLRLEKPKMAVLS